MQWQVWVPAQGSSPVNNILVAFDPNGTEYSTIQVEYL